MATLKDTVKKAAKAVVEAVAPADELAPAAINPSFACTRTLRLPGDAPPKIDDLRREHVAHHGGSGRTGWTRVEITDGAWRAMRARPEQYDGMQAPFIGLEPDVVGVFEHWQFAVVG